MAGGQMVGRRRFLAATAATALAAIGWDSWQAALAEPAVPGAGYGPLQAPDANHVMLPPGFTSRVVARTAEPVGPTDHRWHWEPDGGAVFPMDDGGWVYASNSEVVPDDGYPQSWGGAGAIRFDADGEIADAYSILSGSALQPVSNNCAGGATPWGTWLSCEEQGPVGRVFECRVDQPSQGVVRPAMGLFSHEAAAIDPRDHAVYMTEDSGGGDLPDRLSWGRLYRYTPLGPADDPLLAGALQVLIADGDPYDGTTGPWDVGWSLPVDPLATTATSRLVGGTPFDGGEGCWFDDGSVYFTTKGDNRVWRLDVDAQTLSVLYDDAHFMDAGRDVVLSGVDNITVSPAGELFVAEDGGNQELVLLTPTDSGRYEVSPFLRLVGHGSSELTGPAFTPDGRRLYLSSQRGVGDSRVGETFEITGPFAPARTTTEPVPSSPTSTGPPSTSPPSTAPPASEPGTPAGEAPSGTLRPDRRRSGADAEVLPVTGGAGALPAALFATGAAAGAATAARALRTADEEPTG